MANEKSTAERFWSKVEVRSGTECWPWVAATTGGKYGQFVLHGTKHTTAHRAAWLLAVGPIPDGLCVLHRCDNPSCCNPEHLFLGTPHENVSDCISKGRCGRRWKGVNGRRKLTTDIVRQIRADPRVYRLIAAEYGIHQQTVVAIRTRRSWRHV